MLSALHLATDQPGLGSLRDVSLDLCPGEILGVSGASGSGKRLLLNLLAGHVEPREGSIWLVDRPLPEWDPLDRLRSLGLLERPTDMGGAETPMDLGLDNVALLEDPDPDVVLKALDLVGLRGAAFVSLDLLSNGERRRARLAALLVQTWNQVEDHPRFLLLDRPLEGLEPEDEADLRRALATVSQLGWGLLVTSRQPVAGLADRRMNLCVGRMVDPAALGI